MNEQPLSPAEAQAGLAETEASRRAVIEITGRPFWYDAAAAVGIGVVGGFASLRTAGAVIAGVAIALAVFAALAVLGRRYVRRQGRIMDDRSLFAETAPILCIAAITPLAQLIPLEAWSGWYSVGVGILFTACTLTGLRWENHYQQRRLAAGDYHRYDLL